jgi:Ca2+-binding EF-hand superfamily protein
MRCGLRIGRAFVPVAILSALVCTSASVGAADKGKTPNPAGENQPDQPQELAGPVNADEDAQDDAKTKKAAKKQAAAKANKKVSASRQKRLEKAAQTRKAREEEAAAEAKQLELLQQQQMQQAMMGQGGRVRGGGGNLRNQSMFFMMRQFDTNGNGQLDPQELQAMKLQMAQVQAGGSNVAVAQYLRQFDTNGDGQLSPQEMQAAQAAMTRGMVGTQVGAGGLPLPTNQVLPASR